MEAGREDDPPVDHSEEESVRKPANEGAARLAMENRKRLGPVNDRLDALDDLGQELLAEACLVLVGLGQWQAPGIPTDFLPELIQQSELFVTAQRVDVHRSSAHGRSPSQWQPIRHSVPLTSHTADVVPLSRGGSTTTSDRKGHGVPAVGSRGWFGEPQYQ